MRTGAGKKRRGAVWCMAGLALLCTLAGRVLLPACADRNAPEGCSMQRAKPAQNVCFPLGDGAWRLTDGYGWRTDPFTGKEAFHRGIDLACAEGTLVRAAMAGTVTAARRNADYGSYLRLSHSGGQETLYAHLQYLFVREGETVPEGFPLGTAGSTGRATGAHLHLEFLVRGVRCDPSALAGLP